MIGKRYQQDFNYPILTVMILVIAIGVLTIASATYNQQVNFYLRQIIWAFAGFAVMALLIVVDYNLFERWAYVILGVNLVLLVGVEFVGQTVSGSRRWINFGVFSFQPSELLKLTVVIALSKYFSSNKFKEQVYLRDLVAPLAIIFAPAAVVMKQPDLGTAVVTVLIGLSTVAFANISRRTIVVAIPTLLLLLPIGGYKFWHHLKDYQKNRIISFISPQKDPLGTGYHIIQSKIAVGSGGFFGKGYLKGSQAHNDFIPEQHTDFIFSVLAEEWGFVGSIILIGLYATIIIWGFLEALAAKNRFGRFLALGLTFSIMWQVIVNISMVIGILPVVGVPLPLVSYGGTSLITTLMTMGILLNIGMRKYRG